MSKRAQTRTETVHFSIDGDALTRIARDTMLSDLPGKAYRMLTAGLRGDGIERAAPQILDGDMRLIGNESGMQCVPDKRKLAASYKSDLKYVFAGRVRINGSWWRPKARVTMFGRDDARFALDQRADNSVPLHDAAEANKRMRQFHLDRVAYYANRGEQAVAVGKGVLLFEAISEPPFWWNECSDVEAALAEFLGVGRRLEELTHAPERSRTAYADELQDEADALEELGDEERAARVRARVLIRTEFERDMGLADAQDDRDLEYEEQVRELRAKIREQAGNDMMPLVDDNGGIVEMVARAPFMHWTLDRTSLKHLAPPWQTVCPSGMKLQLDDPNHTDWWLSGGFDISDAYDREHPAKKASERMMFELQQMAGKFECAVLVDGEEVSGTVGKDIAVLPDLHPDRIDALTTAKAVVTEVGGKLAHLAQVALERSIPIMLMPGACTKLPAGTEVTITPSTGRVHIRSKYE